MIPINTNKLKGKIAENGLTITELAEIMGIDKSTLYRKISNNGETMLVKDAQAIAKALSLTKDDAVSIFFSETVA